MLRLFNKKRRRGLLTGNDLFLIPLVIWLVEIMLVWAYTYSSLPSIFGQYNTTLGSLPPPSTNGTAFNLISGFNSLFYAIQLLGSLFVATQIALVQIFTIMALNPLLLILNVILLIMFILGVISKIPTESGL